MKPSLLLAALVVPALMSSCTVVERDGYYRHPHRHPYREVVVTEPGPVGIVYYNDVRGRYYWRNHRRVYETVY